MRTFITTAAILGLTLAPALAQSSTTQPNTAGTSSSNSGSTSAPMTPGAMQTTLKHDLSQAGFTDIQVMPSSFLVRAKDKAGHPVMMVINPDSVTEIATVGKHAASK